MKELLASIARGLVENPAAVTVTVKLSGRPMDGASLRKEVCGVEGVVEVRLISEE